MCAESSWATDVDGNGIFATVFNDGKINYMDCVSKFKKVIQVNARRLGLLSHQTLDSVYV